VQALTRDISDHTPLVLDCGTSTTQGNQRPFQFELCWLLTNGFFEQVRDVWNNENRGRILYRDGNSRLGGHANI
jgi:hypothetical protein